METSGKPHEDYMLLDGAIHKKLEKKSKFILKTI